MNIQTCLDWLRARENNSVAVFWWSMPVALLPMAIVSSGYAQTVAWSAVFAAMACVAAIAAVSYRIMSFITIFCVMTLAAYPLAVFANLLLEQPVVRDDLWPQTHWAMWGCAVGSLCLALGASAANLSRRKSEDIPRAAFSFPVAPVSFSLGLFSILPAVAWAKWYLGLYFHSSIQPYNFAAQHYLNSLEHMTWIAYVGIFLQVVRFIEKQTAKDGVVALVMVVIAIALFLPSGNRMQAIGFLPLLLIAYLSWEAHLKRKVVLVLITAVCGATIFYSMSIWRNNPQLKTGTFTEQALRFSDAVVNRKLDTNNGSPSYQFIYRFSEYVATGRIIDATPRPYPYRFFEGMGSWWQILVPGFLRPASGQINFMDGAEIALKYGVTKDRQSSVPVMLLGDLFSRFGWGGIAAGMFMVGFVLRKLDSIPAGNNMFLGVIFFVLFARIVWQLHTDSLLVAVAYLTRELFVIYISSFVLAWAALRLSSSHARRA